MSGGLFDYEDMKLINIIDTLKKDDYPTEKLENLLKSVMSILHAYDWFRCGDTNERDFKKVYYEEIQKIKKLLK